MTGRHTAPIEIPADPHGYIALSALIKRYSLVCGCIVMVAFILATLARIGVL